ncbi:MAG: V-type ATP synthase subunit E family protein, partial [Clostridia bacterium]
MDGKDAIIEKILTNAKAQADGLVTEASEYANRIVADATAQGKRAVGEAQKQAEIACNEHISRRLTVCELDIKKIKLSAKKQVLDEVFARAGESVSQLKPDDYKRVILGMLDESAEDGDIITVAKSDEKVITSAFIADYAKKRGIKLSLDSAFGDFK